MCDVIGRRKILGLAGGALLTSAAGAGPLQAQAGARQTDGTLPRWFDVRAYGAAGDSKAKDKAAIQKAIDACHDARGGVVCFPPGE
jgi:alpha-L-rhamnosidase